MTISRRDLLGLGSLLIAACGTRVVGRDANASPLAPTPYVPHDDDPPPSCSGATAANIEGPFYKSGAPHKAVLAERDERGERLVVVGSVLTTDCRPVPNVVLDIWHADARGGYDLDGYHLRGTLTTDARGRYELHTIVPGRYLNGKQYRPAHVHVKLRADGHDELTTQLYFEGDPYNDVDPFIVESLIMKTKKLGATRRATFDFVLS